MKRSLAILPILLLAACETTDGDRSRTSGSSSAAAACTAELREFDRVNDRIYPRAYEAFQEAREASRRGDHDRCRSLMREANARQQDEARRRQDDDLRDRDRSGSATGRGSDDDSIFGRIFGR